MHQLARAILIFTAAALLQAAALAARTGKAGDADMVMMRGGNFMMGSPESEEGRGKDESLHEVTISPFFMSAFEVTQQEYEQAMGENPSSDKSDPKMPVDNVTWLEAVKFCNALSAMKGLPPAYAIDGTSVSWDQGSTGYRLPTEAEWEYAARAGGSPSPWFASKGLKPVGSGFPSAFRLYDMEGSVAEWVFDW